MTDLACQACAIAETNPDSGLTHDSCKECAAREIARNSMEYASAMLSLSFTPAYMEILHKAFGADWEAGHRRVRHWARKAFE